MLAPLVKNYDSESFNKVQLLSSQATFPVVHKLCLAVLWKELAIQTPPGPSSAFFKVN